MIDAIFDLGFWFDKTPAALTPFFEKFFFIFFVLVLIGGLVVRIINKQRKHDTYITQVFYRFTSLLITMSILGLVWFFLTFEQIPLLGSRFWFLIWILGAAVWAFFILRFLKKDVPRLRAQDQVREERERYFTPRRKKKRKK